MYDNYAHAKTCIMCGTFKCPDYMLAALRDLRNGRIENSYCGIAYNLEIILSKHSHFMGSLVHDWLESIYKQLGLQMPYPVEQQVCNDWYSAWAEYIKQENKFDSSNVYGKLRLELLDKLIRIAENDQR